MIKVLNKFGLLLSAFLIFSCESGISQNVPFDSYMDGYTSTYVTSLEEFMQRFNADAFHPEINAENDEKLRARSILTLFDWQEFHVQDSAVAHQLISFAESVCNDSIRLNLENDGLYAEAYCFFSYLDQEIPLNLVLVYESIRDDYYKWSVVGANGLVECGLLDTIRDGYLNPVQHEMHFSELTAACDDLSKYISIDKKVDQLSFVLGMLETSQLQFVACNKVLFHFTQVPGYVFVVDKKYRLDRNSGYLICNLLRTEESQKTDYINQLLGKK